MSRFLLLLTALATSMEASNARLQSTRITITPEHPSKGQIAPDLLPGCRVVLLTDRAETQTRPCAPFTLTPGRYSVWLESDEFISSEAWGLTVGHESLQHVAPIVRAATVRVEDPGEDFDVRVFALMPSKKAFSRIVRPNEPALMPAGPVVAVATDARERVVAVSSPKDLPAGGNQTLAFTNARRILAARARVPSRDPASFSLFVDERVAPGVFIHQENLGVWYDLTEPTAVLGVDSPTLGMPPVQVELSRTGVTYAALELQRKPDLTVTIEGEPAVLDSLRPIEIAIIDEATGERLDGTTLTSHQHAFRSVEPRLLRCELKTNAFKRTEVADLTMFANADVRFALEPIKVSGRVTLGREPARGSVTFRRPPTTIRAETDEDGRYSAVLWHEGKHSAEVRLEDPAVPPHRDMVDAIGNEVTVDFHLPKPSLALRIVDDRTGEPIRKASVSMRNAWEDEKAGSRGLVQTVFSDENGEATLPGFRPGGVVVHVNANGYERPAPLELTAGESDEFRRLEVRLKRLQGAAVQLRLPDGAAAARARVLLVRADGQSSGATADENGSITIPSAFSDCLLLVKHSTFSHAQRWLTGQNAVVLAGKGSTLLVKVQDPAGKAVRFAEVMVWIHGIPLAGAAVAFLSDGHVSADSTGLWTAPNAPGVPLRIAATRPGAEKNLAALQVIARDAQPPWPPMVTVTSN